MRAPWFVACHSLISATPWLTTLMHDYLTNSVEVTRLQSIGIAALSGHNRVFQHTRNEGCFVCEAFSVLGAQAWAREKEEDDTLILVESSRVPQTVVQCHPNLPVWASYFGLFLHKSLESFVSVSLSSLLPSLPTDRQHLPTTSFWSFSFQSIVKLVDGL